MSQQGADDWWQKLYEDPDAGPEPDPGDTLDHRFRSAAVVVTEPSAPPGPRPQTPPDPVLPGQRQGEPNLREPEAPRPNPPTADLRRPNPPAPDLRRPDATRPDLPVADVRRPDVAGPDVRRPDVAGPDLRRADATRPDLPVADVRRPDGTGLDLTGPDVRRPDVIGPDVRRPDVAGPNLRRPDVAGRDVRRPDVPGAGGTRVGSEFGRGVGSERAKAGWDPRAGGISGVPGPPRDPRQAGPTGYALGDVTVPPVQPEPPELPVWRWGVPRADTPAPPEPEKKPERKPEERKPGPEPAPARPAAERPEVRHLGDRAPTYAAEPGSLPVADPGALDRLVPDTVLEGARHGTYTLRAASVRGDSARYRGEARRDFLLTARFGTGDDSLVLVALAGGDRAASGAREAAAEVCQWVAAAIGRSQERLAEDIRAGRRDALRSGLQRLTDRAYGRLRARAAELGLADEEYTAGLRGLLLPVDPEIKTRVCFGTGAGGLFRLRAGRWEDLEPVQQHSAPEGAPDAPDGPREGAEDSAGAFRLRAAAARPGDTPGPGGPREGAEEPVGGFRFRAAVARPGDTLLLCSGGLADPMREEGLLPAELAARWAEPDPPGLAAFLADTQLRLKGYADDRTAAAVWEA
ncbi:protein phosphatase 2C domain-containing protein [Streptomyces sp. APSN-46.1]|uniref:protein phosphatase 2C domain-containing protein n=1 Tax=Streptomyces sp. APSN-46.1 TaxID=2929049 RepID=UPI001FB2DB90|nr:protein phosphatase 2C domain-containing protein [Streptomyces sp. APSN-46.1]MCJ1680132.1 protein phosphatase 2C domain-containing protein [Streptomyces sp. APSN-46.1]